MCSDAGLQVMAGAFRQEERQAKQLQAASVKVARRTAVAVTKERVAEGRYEEGAARRANS